MRAPGRAPSSARGAAKYQAHGAEELEPDGPASLAYSCAVDPEVAPRVKDVSLPRRVQKQSSERSLS